MNHIPAFRAQPSIRSTNSPTLHSAAPSVGDSSCAAQQAATVAAEQAALDDGVDYFSAQGAIDAYNLARKAE
jgi:hypothetical protein